MNAKLAIPALVIASSAVMCMVIGAVAWGAAINASQSNSKDSCSTDSGAQSGQSAELTSAKVYAAGDSIMVGLATTEKGAQEPLRKKIDKKAKSFSADAFGGENLTYGIDNIDRGKLKDADIVIMEFGTNGYGPDFKSEVDRAIKMIRNEAGEDVKIFWVEIFSGGVVNEWKTRFNTILKAESRISVIPTKNLGYNSQLENAKIHPNIEGYEKLAEDIISGLDESTQSGDNCDPASSDGGSVSGNVKELAAEILKRIDAGKILQDYKSSSGDTVAQLQRAADGKKMQMTCADHGGPKDVDVNPAILKFILDADDNGAKVAISNITDKCHSSPASNHYKGLAIDLTCTTQNMTVINRSLEKYGGHNNGEVCPGAGHWHYDFLKQ